jgi:hypothetical protein
MQRISLYPRADAEWGRFLKWLVKIEAPNVGDSDVPPEFREHFECYRGAYVTAIDDGEPLPHAAARNAVRAWLQTQYPENC